MVTPDAKRNAVAHARETFGLSERRACSLVGVARRVVRYEPTRPDDASLRVRLRELAGERRRFGYRRLGYLLAREGLVPNHKKLLRIYREEGLKVRRRGGRKQVMLAGWLTDVRTIMGDRPGKILILDDRTAQLVCWLDFQDWQRFQTMLRPDTLVFATGSISASQREGRELEYRLSPRSFYDLDALMRERTERITLAWKKPPVAVTALPQRLAPWRGPNGATISVEYFNGVARAVLDWGTDWRLKFETAAETELKRLFGPESVKAEYRRWVAPVSSNQRSRAEYDDGE